MSNQSSNNTLVILGIIGGVLLLGFVAVVGVFVVSGFFWYQMAVPARPPMPVTVETASPSVEAVDSDSQEPASAPELPVQAPVPDTATTLQQPNDGPVIAPVPAAATVP
jgi:hypothetical protein